MAPRRIVKALIDLAVLQVVLTPQTGLTASGEPDSPKPETLKPKR